MFPFFKILGGGIFAGGAGGEAVSFTHLARSTVTGADATTVSFSGLSLANRACLMFSIRLVHAASAAIDLACHVNGNTTNTDYNTEFHIADASSALLGRTNTNRIASVVTNSSAYVYGYASIVNSRAHIVSNGLDEGTNVRHFNFACIDDTNTETNITSLAFTASVASTIEIGSIFDVFALEADA